ncbi:Calcineurin-like phosphoesterase [Parapedobacter koreensis]|uniref:Calcineurin-like phosphoesterase n=2 Tax=Parapedobacter koreensis TaxID=332977 RepID=A0A1H7F5W3_9SPHI|nr:Calcineurin-like phosphoesterase [Parapedobacter koreensis]
MWKERLIIIFALSFATAWGHAQDSISHRIIFIGDAGEINHKQETVVPRAADLVIPGKTTAIFLGDNIYPKGMGLPGSKEEPETQAILRSQFVPMRAKGAPVYFIPGNHDWDRMGKQGLAKIRAQGRFLANQQDSLLKLLPPEGCPDPQVINISDSLVVIAFDSEWWVFPHERYSGDADCECETEAQVTEKLQELFYDHQDKTILLAIHHPLRSYGTHGGYYSWKDHLFPLTLLNKGLYVPLPGLGSLYPLLRRTVFLNPEDIPHPRYQALIEAVDGVSSQYPNVIHVAGHDHGLQFIKDGDFYQVVSGAGSKDSYTKQGAHALFTHAAQGFVVIDHLMNKSSKVTFYTYADDTVKEAFSYRIPHRVVLPFVDQVGDLAAGKDSVVVQANVKYDEVGSFHRKLFGENYRKEWATETEVPVIRLSELHGGLRPVKRGGGMQTVSLRLVDPTGKEWVLRSVNKQADALLPEALRHTIAHDFLDDANSAQHPYSALIFPPLAKAAGVPHTHPIIGLVAPDTLLGHYNESFANTLCLLEEREPLGESDNTVKMLRHVNNDNDDSYKAKTFLRARMLDLLVNDWDRHADQWRWRDENKAEKGADRDYLGIPRDRDQALRKMEGLFPSIVSMPFALPLIQGFAPEIHRVNYSLRKSDFLNAHPKNQFTHEEWMEEVADFVTAMTDSTLEAGLRLLPKSVYALRHDELLHSLKARRDALPAAMNDYYQFANRIVDVKLSNKHEQVVIEDAPGESLRVTVRKINKEGEVKRKLMEKVYPSELTKEVRVYLASGDDSVQVDAAASPVAVRVIGGVGTKHYDIRSARRKVAIYDQGTQSSFSPSSTDYTVHYGTDSVHTAFVPVNLYNVWAPLLNAGYNADDGLLLGAGFHYTHQRGFRKEPFNHTQQFLLSGSFATGALRMHYRGHWKEVLGKADVVVAAHALIPQTQNYFGLGNGTEYDRDGRDMRYYRTRFELYQLEPHLAWNPNATTTFAIGPSLQWYRLAADRNEGRLIVQPGTVHTYDSLIVQEDKGHVGLFAGFMKDNRNNKLRPSRGGYFQARVGAYGGISDYAKSYAQANAEMAVYAGLAQDAVVVSNRIGGGVTFGHPAFYQSQFIGGQGNLRGFRQYRFAGDHSIFNNLELRARAAYIGNYILPGELGVIAFYDVGKVWSDVRQSDRIQQGIGGGLYYIAANIAVLQVVVGHSREGWYPYFGIGFRF